MLYVRYYSQFQSNMGIVSTLSEDCNSVEEVLSKIDDRIRDNFRIKDLTQTLSVHNPKFYNNHEYYGLNEEELLTDDLIERYSKINDGSKQDILVAKAILSSLEKPVESLEEFPVLKKRYLD